MFKKIDLSSDLFKEYKSDNIDNLSKVNLFVGQNNSGKSRLLRNLFSIEEIKFDLKDLSA